MHEKLMYNALYEGITTSGGGNCPHDAGCGFGIAVQECAAPEEELERRFAQLRKEWEAEREGHGFYITGIKSKWPCAACIEGRFNSPEGFENS